jgi:hypothetical protein
MWNAFFRLRPPESIIPRPLYHPDDQQGSNEIFINIQVPVVVLLTKETQLAKRVEVVGYLCQARIFCCSHGNTVYGLKIIEQYSYLIYRS